MKVEAPVPLFFEAQGPRGAPGQTEVPGLAAQLEKWPRAVRDTQGWQVVKGTSGRSCWLPVLPGATPLLIELAAARRGWRQ